MAKSNIVYQYFKKATKENTIFIQYDSIRGSGSTLTVAQNGDMELEENEFGEGLPDQLKAEGFEPASPLEFHILINGLNQE